MQNLYISQFAISLILFNSRWFYVFCALKTKTARPQQLCQIQLKLQPIIELKINLEIQELMLFIIKI